MKINIIVLIFSIGLVRSKPGFSDSNISNSPVFTSVLNDFKELATDIGGDCINSRIDVLVQKGLLCIFEKIEFIDKNSCLFVTHMMQCLDTLKECYTNQEHKNYKSSILNLGEKYGKVVDADTFKDCPEHMMFLQ